MSPLQISSAMSFRSPEITFTRIQQTPQLQTAARLREQLMPVLSQSGHVVLDLRSARLDGAGLGTVLSIQCRLRYQERALFVINDDPELRRLMEAAGVAGSLTLVDDVEEALRRASAC